MILLHKYLKTKLSPTLSNLRYNKNGFFKEVHESGFLKKLKNSCKLLNNIKIYCNLFMN